jgi:hypothetical protein
MRKMQELFEDFPFLRGTFPLELVSLNYEGDLITDIDEPPSRFYAYMKSEALAIMQLYEPENVHQKTVRRSIDFVIEHMVPMLPRDLHADDPGPRLSPASQK